MTELAAAAAALPLGGFEPLTLCSSGKVTLASSLHLFFFSTYKLFSLQWPRPVFQWGFSLSAALLPNMEVEPLKMPVVLYRQKQ